MPNVLLETIVYDFFGLNINSPLSKSFIKIKFKGEGPSAKNEITNHLAPFYQQCHVVIPWP